MGFTRTRSPYSWRHTWVTVDYRETNSTPPIHYFDEETDLHNVSESITPSAAKAIRKKTDFDENFGPTPKSRLNSCYTFNIFLFWRLPIFS